MYKKTFLLLGGNVGDRLKHINTAINLIEKYLGPIIKKSSVYQTEAWGNTEQEAYFNQVIELQTQLSAEEILKEILNIELSMGRSRNGHKWSSRIIDIDILFYDSDIIKSENLTIPHPLIQDRKFALLPLAEISPSLQHPVLKQSIKQLLENCTDPLNAILLKIDN